MSKTKVANKYDPDYAVPPGRTLQETIDALGMSQKDLATRSGLTAKTINLIVKGEEPISHKTAVAFERVTGVPARIWNKLEAQYRERLARIEDAKQLAAGVAWLKTSGIPVRELIKRNALQETKDRVEQLRRVLVFFGVRNVATWRATWSRPMTAYRRSSKFKLESGPTATWLRLGELRAHEISTAPYDRSGFRSALNDARGFTAAKPEVFEHRLIELCAGAGVAVALVPPIKGCPAYGAARWLTPVKAVIQLSLRGKSDDLLWFTFFHEAAHILNDPKKPIFLDDGRAEDECENAANRFAADLLIPPDAAARLPTLRGQTAIVQFAKEIGIAPGIVVGRMQKEKLIPYSAFNQLKRRFEWRQPD